MFGQRLRSVRLPGCASLQPARAFHPPGPLEIQVAPMLSADAAAIKRQTGFSTISVRGIPCQKCTHGYPQAYMQQQRTFLQTPQSELFRLTCPMLLREIDILEKDKAMEDINAEMAEESSGLREAFDGINRAHARIRAQLLHENGILEEAQKIDHPRHQLALGNGIAGVTQGKLDDVKCLHAHTADGLFRPEKNLFLERTFELLRRKGIDPMGLGQNCHLEKCAPEAVADPAFPLKPVANKRARRTNTAAARLRRPSRTASAAPPSPSSPPSSPLSASSTGVETPRPSASAASPAASGAR